MTVTGPTRESRALRTGTVLVAVLAIGLVCYLLVALIASEIIGITERPFHVGGAVFPILLVLVIVGVGVWSYRSGRRTGLTGGRLIRRMSLWLLAIGLVISIVVVLLSAPI